jgi:hypothetical protein
MGERTENALVLAKEGILRALCKANKISIKILKTLV